VFIIRRSKLCYTASGIITPVGGRPVRGLSEDFFALRSTCARDGNVQSVMIPDAL